MTVLTRASIVFAIGSLLVAPSLRARGSFAFTRIADTETPIPGGAGQFMFFYGWDTAIDDEEVVFVGYGESGPGLYSSSGGVLRRVVDNTTPVPGGGSSFFQVRDPALCGSVTTFSGSGHGGEEGIFSSATTGGDPAVIADRNTQIPGRTDNFAYFAGQSYSNGVALFKGGNGLGQVGLYTNTAGILAEVVGSTSLVPGGTGDWFVYFGDPVIREGEFSFQGWGSGGQLGIYANFGSGIACIADTKTAQPGSGENFVAFGKSSIDDSSVVFSARTATSISSGLYLSRGGVLSVIADVNTAIPDGIGYFTWVGNPAIDSPLVVFQGLGIDGQSGLYISDGESIQKVIAKGDTLDGETISQVAINPHDAISGNSIVFSVFFLSGEEAVYVANLVEGAHSGIPMLSGLSDTLFVVLLGVSATLLLRRHLA